VNSIETLIRDAAPFTPDETVGRSLRLAASIDPTDRNRFAPGHFTASGFVVSPDGSSLLLIHHRRLGRWLQPGGHIDPEDTSPIRAAAREVREETGVETTPLDEGLIDIDIHRIPARAPEPDHEHFDLRFAFRARTVELVDDVEVLDAAWVRWDDLGAYDVDESLLRAVEALRRVVS
jgi:8-oxo-dGTP pyrophosphatase MutT (NUDIX family)